MTQSNNFQDCCPINECRHYTTIHLDALVIGSKNIEEQSSSCGGFYLAQTDQE